MSSIIDKSSAAGAPKLNKKNFFLRSSSIQKIKCSAAYPFRIAGSKLSKEAIKQLLESLIIKARSFSHKALLVMYFTTLKVLGAVTTVSSSASSIQTFDDICDKLKATEKKLTFFERLLARLIKVYSHKAAHQQRKEATTIEKSQERIIEKDSAIPVSRTAAECAASKFYELNKTPPPKKINPLFTAFVYACAIFIYVQLIVLTFALNSVPTPPGLIFMLFSLSIIAYLAFKVFCLKHHNKKVLKRPNQIRKQQSATAATELNTIKHAGNTIDIQVTTRQSRFRIRQTFDFGSKTLSKIKLL